MNDHILTSYWKIDVTKTNPTIKDNEEIQSQNL